MPMRTSRRPFLAGLFIYGVIHGAAITAAGAGEATVWGPPPGSASGPGIADGASGAVNAPGGGAGWELSPSFGMMGGSALLGMKASMAYRPVTLELSAEQVMGRTATLYPVTLNAVLDLAMPDRVVPFAIVGGGVFMTVPSNSVGDETVSTMGLNFGGGLRFYLNRKLGIRFETKQLFTRVENRLEANGREELLIFQSTCLGVIFAFD